jgi:putative DNA primase/helicase
METIEIVKGIDQFTDEELELIVKKREEEKKMKKIVWAHVGERGSVPLSNENFNIFVKHYDIKLRYNEMEKKTQIDLPPYVNDQFHIDTSFNSKITWMKGEATAHKLNNNNLLEFIHKEAAKDAYHPVRDWIESAEWDGVNRLQQYYNSVVCEGDNPIKEALMYKWALSLIAALYHNDFTSEGVLTFVGKQGKGKTSWALMMIPREFWGSWNKTGMILDLQSKDSIIEAISYWLVELGELDATFKKSDITALKAFITAKHDTVRPPYAAAANKYERRTVFYATCNDPHFLRDEENRRFWVLSVNEFVWPEWDPQQFWAQMKVAYDQIAPLMQSQNINDPNREYGWYLSEEEKRILGELQEEHKAPDPIEEMLNDRLVELSKITLGEWQSTTNILMICGITHPNKKECDLASKWLKSNGYQRDRQKRYLVERRGTDLMDQNSDKVKVVDAKVLRDNRLFVKNR